MRFLAVITLMLYPTYVFTYPEPKYPSETQAVQALAQEYDAEVEHRLWDATRVDLLTDEYAIEADWGPKWAEGIGQSLYYAQVTGKKPAVMLLIKDMKAEYKYIYRLQTVAVKYDIEVFLEVIEPL